MKFYLKIGAGVGLLILVLWLLQEFGESDEAPAPPVASAASTPVLTPQPTFTPVPTPIPAPTRPTIPAFINQAAAGANVRLVGAVPSNDWWMITVQGRDRNALNDFLDAAQRAGLRDVDVNYQAYKEFLVNGTQVSQNTYKMRF
jgi:hypothetical protein